MATTTFLPRVDPEIWRRFPDYRALSIVVRGLDLTAPLAIPAVLPASWSDTHIAAWQAAFRAFGSNPKKTPPSLDALCKRFRKDGALPQIHPVVDCYNALSLCFGAPFGGEDVDRYAGSPRLLVADGTEKFDTVRDGQTVEETPDAGEIVWRDDQGVTCRRWNWRQCKRTAITANSRNLWFVIDRLPPLEIHHLEAAGEALVELLRAASPTSDFGLNLLAPPLLADPR